MSRFPYPDPAALSEEKKANLLAERFNRALNTMSHGLVMFGPDGRIAYPVLGMVDTAELSPPQLQALLQEMRDCPDGGSAEPSGDCELVFPAG